MFLFLIKTIIAKNGCRFPDTVCWQQKKTLKSKILEKTSLRSSPLQNIENFSRSSHCKVLRKMDGLQIFKALLLAIGFRRNRSFQQKPFHLVEIVTFSEAILFSESQFFKKEISRISESHYFQWKSFFYMRTSRFSENRTFNQKPFLLLKIIHFRRNYSCQWQQSFLLMEAVHFGGIPFSKSCTFCKSHSFH